MEELMKVEINGELFFVAWNRRAGTVCIGNQRVPLVTVGYPGGRGRTLKKALSTVVEKAMGPVKYQASPWDPAGDVAALINGNFEEGRIVYTPDRMSLPDGSPRGWHAISEDPLAALRIAGFRLEAGTQPWVIRKVVKKEGA